MYNTINNIIKCIPVMSRCEASIVEYEYQSIKLQLEFENNSTLEAFRTAASSHSFEFLTHAQKPNVVIKQSLELNGTILGMTNFLADAFEKAKIPFSAPFTKQAVKNALISSGYVDHEMHARAFMSMLPKLNLNHAEADIFEKIIDVLKAYYELSDYRGYLLTDLPNPDFYSPNYVEQDRSNLRSPLYTQLQQLQELAVKLNRPDITSVIGEYVDDIRHLLTVTRKGGLPRRLPETLRIIQNTLILRKNQTEPFKWLTKKAVDISWCFHQLSLDLASNGHIVTKDCIVIETRMQQDLKLQYIKATDLESYDYIEISITDEFGESKVLGEMRNHMRNALIVLDNLIECGTYDENGKWIG